jgi:hypothetical protein
VSTCTNCSAAIDPGSASCPRCGFLSSTPAAPSRPGPRAFTEIAEGANVRFVMKMSAIVGVVFGVVCAFLFGTGGVLALVVGELGPGAACAGIGAFFGVLSALVFAQSTTLTVDAEHVRIRGFPLPSFSGGVYPRANIARVGWNKTPARSGYILIVQIALRDGAAIPVPVELATEGEALYVVERLQAALRH